MKLVKESLLYKLILMVVLTILIPFLGNSSFILWKNYISTKEQIVEINSSLLMWNQEKLQLRLNNMSDYVLSIYENLDIVNAMISQESFTYMQMIEIKNKMAEVYYEDKNIIGIDITTANGELFTDYKSSYPNLWHRSIGERTYSEGYSLMTDSTGYDFGVYSKKLYNYPKSDYICTINIYFGTDMFGDCVRQLQGDGYESIVLIANADSGKILYASEPVDYNVLDTITPESKECNSLRGKLDGKKGIYFTIGINARDSQLCIIKFLPDSVMMKRAFEIIKSSLIMSIIVFIMMLVFINYLFKSIVSPLIEMEKNIEQVGNGIYAYTARSTTMDEIGILDHKYEEMVSGINKLINQDIRNQMELTKMNLKILQTQINPHFLNNILQSIATQALSEGAEDVYVLLGKLARIFRYNIDMNEDSVPLLKELEHIQNYLELQKQRFKDKLEFEIVCDAAAKTVIVPKIILQPLVENSIKYNTMKADSLCKVKIEIHILNNEFILSVIDNGIGMSDDKKEMIKQKYEQYTRKIEEDQGIGLLNVLWRIQIACGSRMKWDIEDNNPGTRIVISWPLDVSSAD